MAKRSSTAVEDAPRARAGKSAEKSQGAGKGSYVAVERLIDELRLTMHRVVRLGEELHAESELSLGMRAILEALRRRGPSTVPALRFTIWCSTCSPILPPSP